MPALRLGYDPSAVPEGGYVVLSSVATYQKAHWYEPAGHLFHEKALRSVGHVNKVEESEKGGSNTAPASDTFEWQSGGGARAKKGKGKEGLLEEDHYALLGLGHLRYLASDDQIRKAYREVALKHHPDKQASSILEEDTEEGKASRKEEIETRFKSIQAAYEILMDSVKRRNFDSTDEFDDDVPTECTAEEFFKVFGPVFMRNGKWSSQPPPVLGENSSSIVDVDAFYEFWWAFKSWREFPGEDEFDMESADSREHKRWMERQNSKLQEKAKKEENVRIRRLVENAYRKDPRIAKRREDEKKEKQRKKDEKHHVRRQQEAEDQKAAEEEKVRKEAEEKRQAEEREAGKKYKEKEKKLLRKERARLRSAAADCTVLVTSGGAEGAGAEEVVEELCQGLEMDQLKGLCERLEGQMGDRAVKVATLARWAAAMKEGVWESGAPEGEPAAVLCMNGAAVGGGEVKSGEEHGNSAGSAKENGAGSGRNGAAKGVVGEMSRKKLAAEAKAKAAALAAEWAEAARKKEAEAKKREKVWSSEEVAMLRKALVKFPKGTSQRWEVVADFLGTDRSVDEILRAVKTVLLSKPDDSKAFDSFLEKRKNLKDINSPLSSRDDVGDSVPAPAGATKSPKPTTNGTAKAVKPVKPVKPLGASAPAGTAKSADIAAAKGDTAAKTNGAVSSEATANGVAPPGVPRVKSEEAPAWSEDQELSLVKALKACPKETDNRWERIAAAVGGKTKAQCMRKFTAMRENFRTQKTGATAVE